jgi:RIO kinase 1
MQPDADDLARLEHRFEPTFSGSYHEHLWIQESLTPFWEDLWFTDILYKVKGGKEATVYCCEAHPSAGVELIAAKVFRPRMFRAMRNDSLYKLGRGYLDADAKPLLDRRAHRALRKGSRVGKQLDTASWIQHEYQALRDAHAAGAEVPRPLACSTNAILMEYIGDRSGAAPILQALTLAGDEAEALLTRLLESVERLLERHRIHADLSAYNVLVWEGRPVLIDFPQTVDAVRHPTAFELLVRDLDRLCGYFRRQGVTRDPVELAGELWSTCLGGRAPWS